MSEIEKIDHVAIGTSRIIQQYKDKEKFVALVQLLTGKVQDMEDAKMLGFYGTCDGQEIHVASFGSAPTTQPLTWSSIRSPQTVRESRRRQLGEIAQLFPCVSRPPLGCLKVG